MSEGRRRAQVFVELRAEDLEATSALAVVREHVEAGRALVALRRVRLFELAGALPGRAELAEQVRTSMLFCNPARERCVVRAEDGDAAPFGPGETLVLVLEREGERRAVAERWWRRETGERIEVREGLVWAMRFEAGEDAVTRAAELAVTRDRAHGLLANPQFQDVRVWPDPAPPLDWLSRKRTRAPKLRSKRA
jgi:hypothetical protein